MSTTNWFIYGTRPEAIKLYPVVEQVKQKVVICTGQHKDLLDKNFFEADANLNIMESGATLDAVLHHLILELSWTLASCSKASRVVVLGDTITAFAASLIAFHNKLEIAHIEAGLRTYDKYQPYPEEIYRQFISNVADIHFAPTSEAARNISNHAKNLYITGNTIVDAVQKLAPKPTVEKKVIITVHRREADMESIVELINHLVKTNPEYRYDVYIHPNSIGQELYFSLKDNYSQIHFRKPQRYPEFLKELASCHSIFTDSGGVQEEALTLHKPVGVLRYKTERPEGIETGGAFIALGNLKDSRQILNNEEVYQRRASAKNPYGDGKASERIAEVLNG